MYFQKCDRTLLKITFCARKPKRNKNFMTFHKEEFGNDRMMQEKMWSLFGESDEEKVRVQRLLVIKVSVTNTKLLLEHLPNQKLC